MTNGCKFNETNCIMRNDKDCSMMRVIYIIRCMKCKEKLDLLVKEDPAVPSGVMSSHYFGITATSIHNRMLSHLSDHRSKNKQSIMTRHDLDCHGGEVQRYMMDIVTSERHLLLLKMREALLIEGQDPGLSINDRMEQGRGAIIRLAATR